MTEWAEKRVDLTGLSQLEGPYRTDVSPMVRWVFEALQSRHSKKVAVMCAAQSGKTQTLMIFCAWAICEAPGPFFWVMSSEESCEEFTKARLLPLLESIPDVVKRMPKLRTEKTLNLIQFSTMPLYFRGANSPSKLKSTPVRFLVADELSDWKPGAYDKVAKRVRTYLKSKQMLISTPMHTGDDMHSQFLSGTQTFFHFACPSCQHRQPFRFGREKTVIFPDARDKGGFVWDSNDVTKPAGKWNWSELRKTVRYQCENCGAEFLQSEQFKLLQTLERCDRNPTPEPGTESFHWSAIYSLWVKWDDIACEFIAAKERADAGDLEPLKSFVRETLGEPWELLGDTANEDELRKLCGNYTRGDFWPVDSTKRTTRIITCDVQKDHLRFVLCQLREGGELRVVNYGRLSNLDDLRAYQEKHGVANRGVFLDSADGNRQSEILRECVRWNWVAMRGSAQESFAHRIVSTGKVTMRGFRSKQVDPFIGTRHGATKTVTSIEWANGLYKDRLYLFMLKGKGAKLEFPSDVGSEFLIELCDEKRVSSKTARGATVWAWTDSGCNHFGDCLLQALVVMDVTAFTRSVAIAQKNEAED